jgi:ATP-dependent helicase/nuclease subunit B
MVQGALQAGSHLLHTIFLPLDERHAADSIWLRVAQHSSTWLDEQGLALRDAVLLLPFAQHLAPARRAWMQLGRWQPRIETTHSLAASLGPSVLPQAAQITFDAAIDALSAKDLVAQASWAQALRRQDERAYALALARLVEAAHAFARGAAARAPSLREAFWQQAREALSAQASLGFERALALLALEWAAAQAPTPATDALFELRPLAWIYLQAGGADTLSEQLLAHAQACDVPCLRLVADIELDTAFDATAPLGGLAQAVCGDFEDLAQCSAAAVLQQLNAGRAPLALIAQDRVLIRRVRALLERQGVGMQDETGWTLATTPAAAMLMALLRAAQGQASLDDTLAWLKSDLAADLRERAGASALPLLESLCRQRGWQKPAAVRLADLSPASARLWQWAMEALARLQAGGARRALGDWLAALNELLVDLRADVLLLNQDAGEQLLDALWLRRSPWPESAHEQALQHSLLNPAEFLDWVDQSLEAQQYVPATPADAPVVITPLARAILRPFAAVVLPGADAQTLGAAPALPALLSDGLCQQCGLPGQEQQRAAQASAFAQLLRSPQLTLLRSRALGSEVLAPSPLLERLNLALRRAGHSSAMLDWEDARLARALAPQASARGVARVPGLMPARLSASALESLRNCPYQFFGRVLLGLREQDELAAELDKRDFGTWLHAVLFEFHERRQLPQALPGAELLASLAQEQARALGLAPEEFLPYLGSLVRIAPRYLEWWAAREAEGQRYSAGEIDRAIQPFADAAEPLASVILQGRLDRVDLLDGARVLIDYKTSSVASLKARVAQPLEDTQLAVYAALMQAEADGDDAYKPMRALYLALDDARRIEAVEHPEVERSAALLLQGVGEDLQALHEGAALPALGEGSVCEHCEMRGLCRRDDWAEAAL